MKMLHKLASAGAIALALLLPAAAVAQTNPGLTQNQKLTPAQWNNLFASKQDTLGYTPLNQAGGSMSGRLITTAPGASTSGFSLTPGTTPASPVNGDLWMTSSGLFAHVNGVTIGPIGGATSSSFAGTAPIGVTFPSGVVTYGLSVNATLTAGASLGLNLSNANTWAATQAFPNNSLTLAEFPTIGANTVIGSIAGGTPAALSATQLTTLCNVFSISLNGCVPTPGSSTGKFLRDDGTWTTAGGTGTMTTMTAGTDITLSSGATCTTTCTINVASNVTRTIASGTQALGTAAISSGACTTLGPTTATGSATTDVPLLGFNSDPTATTGYIASVNGMLTIIAWLTTNNINFKVCNNTSASITPGAVTLNWRVVR